MVPSSEFRVPGCSPAGSGWRFGQMQVAGCGSAKSQGPGARRAALRFDVASEFPSLLRSAGTSRKESSRRNGVGRTGGVAQRTQRICELEDRNLTADCSDCSDMGEVAGFHPCHPRHPRSEAFVRSLDSLDRRLRSFDGFGIAVFLRVCVLKSSRRLGCE